MTEATRSAVIRGGRTLGPAVAAGIAVAALALRLPGIAQPLGINQGIFSAAAWGMDQGLALYRDLWDQKPPAIHLTYWLAFRLLGPTPGAVFWLDFAAAGVTGVLLALVGFRLGGRLLGWTTLLLWSVLSLPAIRYQAGGFLERAVPETFIGLLVPAALLCALAARGGTPASHRGRRGAPLARRDDREYREYLREEQRSQRGCIAGRMQSALHHGLPEARRSRPAVWQTCTGLLLGIAVVYKPNAAVFWPLLVVCAISTPRIRAGLHAAVYISLGSIVAPVLTAFWLWQQGLAREAWIAVVEYNRVYVAVAMGADATTLVDAFAHDVWRRAKTDPLWMSGMLGAAWSVGTWWTRTADPVSRLLPWWLGLSLLGAMGMGVRLYNAYFIACLPPLVLATAWALTRPWRTGRRVEYLAAAAVLLAGSAVALRVDSIGRVRSATLADLTYSHDYVGYLERFGAYAGGGGYSARANHELMEWLRAHSQPDDRVFIFGMQAGVYFETPRLPGHRLLWVGPAVEGLLDRPEFTLERLAADLAASRPRFIIREDNNGDSMLGWRVQTEFVKPPMQAVLRSYEQAAGIEDFTIYRLRAADE